MPSRRAPGPAVRPWVSHCRRPSLSPALPGTHHQHGEEGSRHQGTFHDDEVDAAGQALQHRGVEAGQRAVTQGPCRGEDTRPQAQPQLGRSPCHRATLPSRGRALTAMLDPGERVVELVEVVVEEEEHGHLSADEAQLQDVEWGDAQHQQLSVSPCPCHASHRCSRGSRCRR